MSKLTIKIECKQCKNRIQCITSSKNIFCFSKIDPNYISNKKNTLGNDNFGNLYMVFEGIEGS